MESFCPLVVVFLLCLLQGTWAGRVCCPGITNCYTNDLPYQLFPLPDCPESQGIVMKVYTRRNPKEGQLITRNNIPSVFNGQLLSMFVVHGWLQNENYTWMHELKDAALRRGDYNVIIVGWSIGALKLSYPKSCSNTRTVGAEIALVSNHTIANGGSSRARQYCVGHSLGGHVCGHAGKQGQFGRITGLDPAGPWFQENDIQVGLNPSCADLVDVIHTNGPSLLNFGLGTLRRLGHVDFYPNRGCRQPGCTIDPFSGLINLKGIFYNNNNTYDIAFEATLGCSHIRAYEFFIESINNSCFNSREVCSNQYFLPFLCSKETDVVQSMGFDSNRYSRQGIFYLTTNPESPFCRH